MVKLLVLWIIVGVIVGYFKIRQSRQLGFNRKIEVATLPYFIIGVILWPLILVYIFRERKMHREAYLKSKIIRTALDEELDELEKELDKFGKDNNK